jgi:DNA-nicking Smr family endonuclease
MKDRDPPADRADAHDLFHDATRDVKRLRVKVTPPLKPRPRPRAAFTRADQQAVLRESLEPHLNPVLTDPALLEAGDELAFRRNGISETTLRKLRRGHFAANAELDLHGLTGPQARVVLREFLSEHIHRGSRCVRVVHGKGLGSGPRGPVLKNVVNRDLRRIAAVAAFGSARQVDGGSGAVYVLLDASR